MEKAWQKWYHKLTPYIASKKNCNTKNDKLKSMIPHTAVGEKECFRASSEEIKYVAFELSFMNVWWNQLVTVVSNVIILNIKNSIQTC